MLANRNMRSMAINLKSEEGKRIIYQLIQDYDIVIENFRPGVMEKLGFGYEALKEHNPRIIIALSADLVPAGHTATVQDRTFWRRAWAELLT